MKQSGSVVRPEFRKNEYVTAEQGTAVRKLQPKSRREAEAEARREERRRRWEKQIHERAIQTEFEHRRRVGNLFSRAEAMVVALMAAVLLGSCAFYLSQVAAESAGAAKTQKLAREYAQLQEDNNALSSSIEGSIDHAAIYRYATEEKGMHYPASSQVIAYMRSDLGRVSENEPIPTN